MKKKFKEMKGVKFVGSILKGVLFDPTKPIIGAFAGVMEGVKKIKTDNLNSEVGGQGKHDKTRLIAAISTPVILLLIYFDIIDMETLNIIIESLTGITE